MSDTASNVNIEDVLTSIRRLVSVRSEGDGEEATPAEPVEAEDPGRLVLTPSLRVSEEQGGMQSPPEVSELEQKSSVQVPPGSDLSGQSPVDDALSTPPSGAVAADAVLFLRRGGQEDRSEPAEPALVLHDPALPVRGDTATKAAELEEALLEQTGEWEPDGSEVKTDQAWHEIADVPFVHARGAAATAEAKIERNRRMVEREETPATPEDQSVDDGAGGGPDAEAEHGNGHANGSFSAELAEPQGDPFGSAEPEAEEPYRLEAEQKIETESEDIASSYSRPVFENIEAGTDELEFQHSSDPEPSVEVSDETQSTESHDASGGGAVEQEQLEFSSERSEDVDAKAEAASHSDDPWSRVPVESGEDVQSADGEVEPSDPWANLDAPPAMVDEAEQQDVDSEPTPADIDAEESGADLNKETKEEVVEWNDEVDEMPVESPTLATEEAVDPTPHSFDFYAVSETAADGTEPEATAEFAQTEEPSTTAKDIAQNAVEVQDHSDISEPERVTVGLGRFSGETIFSPTEQSDDTSDEKAVEDADELATYAAAEQVVEDVADDEEARRFEDALSSESSDMPTAAVVSSDPGYELTEDELETQLPALSMDDAEVRELVSNIVREELRGELGERITGNVRKLVRREIHRVLASLEMDG